MSVEQRNGRLYWYARRRVNGRVRAEYHGPVSGDEAALIRRTAAVETDRRRAARQDRRAVEGAADAALAAGQGFEGLADRMFRAVMHLCGFRLHNRSEWRKKRGVPMPTLQDLTTTAGPRSPAQPLVKPLAEDPEVQRVFDRAAAGDTAALPAVRELLADRRYLDAIGAVGRMAELALVRQAAGDDLAVGLAVEQKVREYTAKLLEDAGPEPTYAERMTATRAAHNWVTVHILESLAARYPEGGPQAAAIDRRVSLADRRLNASLKALAVLRRLRRPVVAQVNVANGPMVVNNSPG